MPLAPQFIPKRVVEYDSKLPDQHVTQTRSIKPPGLVFGKRLEELEQDDRTCVPKIALQLVEHIQNNGKNQIASSDFISS
jgi:hypothetical protein